MVNQDAHDACHPHSEPATEESGKGSDNPVVVDRLGLGSLPAHSPGFARGDVLTLGRGLQGVVSTSDLARTREPDGGCGEILSARLHAKLQ